MRQRDDIYARRRQRRRGSVESVADIPLAPFPTQSQTLEPHTHIMRNAKRVESLRWLRGELPRVGAPTCTACDCSPPTEVPLVRLLRHLDGDACTTCDAAVLQLPMNTPHRCVWSRLGATTRCMNITVVWGKGRLAAVKDSRQEFCTTNNAACMNSRFYGAACGGISAGSAECGRLL